MAISRQRAEADGQLGGGIPELKNKEKLDWESIETQVITIKNYVEGKNADGEVVIAVIPEEYPDHFLWAGSVVSGWIKTYGADFNGTKIEVGEMKKTKAGRSCRDFDIVD